MDRQRDNDGQFTQEVTPRDVVEAMQRIDGTELTTSEITERCECSRDTVLRRLRGLEDAGRIKRRETSTTTLWRLV